MMPIIIYKLNFINNALKYNTHLQLGTHFSMYVLDRNETYTYTVDIFKVCRDLPLSYCIKYIMK